MLIDEIDHVLIDMVTRFVSNDAKPVIKNGKLHLFNKIVGFTASKEAAFIEAELNFIKAYHYFSFFDTHIEQPPMVPHYMTFDEFLEMQFKKDSVY